MDVSEAIRTMLSLARVYREFERSSVSTDAIRNWRRRAESIKTVLADHVRLTREVETLRRERDTLIERWPEKDADCVEQESGMG